MSDSALRARFATPQEATSWDEILENTPHGGDFLTTNTFANTKAKYGWTPRRIVFERAGVREHIALVLERNIPFLGKYWYIARGPYATTPTAVAEQLEALRSLTREHAKSVFTITFEPPIVVEDPKDSETGVPEEFARLGAVRRPSIQGNASTAIVDLDRSDDELIASFDKKCRNMVRRAQRDEVVVRELPANRETFDHMHRLMTLVGGGDANLVLRPREYTEAMWQGYADAGQGRFYAIDVDGTPAVMAFMIKIGDRAFYKDGGSERSRVSPGMSNLIIWQMMIDAKAAGAKDIDLFGIAPAWATSTEDHFSYGLGLFKLSYSRERTDYIGAFDLVLKPTNYRLWQQIGERITSKLHRTKYKEISLH